MRISVGNDTFAGGSNKSKARGFAMLAAADIEVDGRTILPRGKNR